MAARSIPPQALLQTTVANKEITFYIARDYVTALLWALRDDESLRFELASSISGVDYGEKVARRLHVVYELTSMTYRRHIRLEVAVDVDDAHVPSPPSRSTRPPTGRSGRSGTCSGSFSPDTPG